VARHCKLGGWLARILADEKALKVIVELRIACNDQMAPRISAAFAATTSRSD
jgi:hypothetical protein